jgi:hypothetical protein
MAIYASPQPLWKRSTVAILDFFLAATVFGLLLYQFSPGNDAQVKASNPGVNQAFALGPWASLDSARPHHCVLCRARAQRRHGVSTAVRDETSSQCACPVGLKEVGRPTRPNLNSTNWSCRLRLSGQSQVGPVAGYRKIADTRYPRIHANSQNAPDDRFFCDADFPEIGAWPRRVSALGQK